MVALGVPSLAWSNPADRLGATMVTVGIALLAGLLGFLESRALLHGRDPASAALRIWLAGLVFVPLLMAQINVIGALWLGDAFGQALAGTLDVARRNLTAIAATAALTPLPFALICGVRLQSRHQPTVLLLFLGSLVLIPLLAWIDYWVLLVFGTLCLHGVFRLGDRIERLLLRERLRDLERRVGSSWRSAIEALACVDDPTARAFLGAEAPPLLPDFAAWSKRVAEGIGPARRDAGIAVALLTRGWAGPDVEPGFQLLADAPEANDAVAALEDLPFDDTPPARALQAALELVRGPPTDPEAALTRAINAATELNGPWLIRRTLRQAVRSHFLSEDP